MTQMTEAEADARRRDPHVWALDPPDVSSSNERRNSLLRARERLGEISWNPVTETYEETPHG